MKKLGAYNNGPQPSNEIPYRGAVDRDSVVKRRQWLEQKINVKLPHLNTWWSDKGHVRETGLQNSIENAIGFAKVAVGLAGPLLIDGTHAKGMFYAPIATVEGLVVASMSRGAKVASMCGGVKAYTGRQRMCRSPVFVTDSPHSAQLLGDWLLQQKERLNALGKTASTHSTLKEIHVYPIWKELHVFFAFETEDAAGQNMTTAAATVMLTWVRHMVATEAGLQGVTIVQVYTDGGWTGDKKQSSANPILGRGLACSASVDLTEDVIKNKFHCTPQRFLEYFQATQRMQESICLSGTSFHIPNALTSFFIATGQDAAAATESAYARTEVMQLPNGDVRCSVNLPCLVIGTVGGATTLPTQRECLEIIGCFGPGKVRKLGEIIASFTLCLEISLIGAMAAGEFAASIENLGRMKKLPSSKL